MAHRKGERSHHQSFDLSEWYFRIGFDLQVAALHTYSASYRQLQISKPLTLRAANFLVYVHLYSPPHTPQLTSRYVILALATRNSDEGRHHHEPPLSFLNRRIGSSHVNTCTSLSTISSPLVIQFRCGRNAAHCDVSDAWWGVGFHSAV